MPVYAQTIIQLYNQLQNAGYSNSDLILIRDTYGLAMSLFSSHYQPSGKSFLAHGIGTASILGSLKQPAHLIAAGLIHNIYLKGDFGNGTKGITKAKRKYIRHTLGKDIEDYVALFAGLRWNSQTISKNLDNPDELKQIDRDVILLYLADHLEHLLDMDVLYFNAAASQRYTQHNYIDAEIANKIDLPTLAFEFERIGNDVIQHKIPSELVTDHTESYTLPPKSYKKRLSAHFVQKFNYLRSKVKFRKMLGLKK